MIAIFIVQGGDEYYLINKITATAIQASVIGQLPIYDAFSAFGRLGVGKIDTDYDYTNQSLRVGERYGESFPDSEAKTLFGIGASFDIAELFSLRAEYNQYAKINKARLSALTVGATYHF